MKVLHFVVLSIQWFLLFFWAYWFIIGLFGFGRARPLRQRPPQTRFAILIPAHNEETVIGNLVENLMHMEYPREMYDVYVIADNCTDRTAEVSAAAGAKVIEHTSLPGEPKGKPYAIRYAIEYLGEDLYDKYDAVSIFDADNLVSLNYLQTMNDHLVTGGQLVQCYLDSKNPHDNWITLSYATSYYYMNRSWQLAKSRLGLGNALGGTGFCMTTKLLKEIGWHAKSLTEDLEFTMQCLLRGIPAQWNHFARVYDEKPQGFKASCVQRLRWARGHWDVCFRYVLRLLWRAIRHADIRAFDGAMYLLNPGKIVLSVTVGIILYLEWFTPFKFAHNFMPWWVWLSCLLFNILYIAASILADARQRINCVKAVISLVFFNYTYVPLFVYAMFTMWNRNWKRTDHVRSIMFSDISSLHSMDN